MTASPLVQQVLALPYEEREALLAALIESLEGGPQEPQLRQEQCEQAWGAEIERRLRDVDEGRVQTIPADDVFKEMRARRAARR